jgi:hypothetical protein
MGFGRWKTPQFVMPRTTPPAFRTMLPVVFAILWVWGQRRRGGGRGEERDGLADFGEVAGADLWWLLVMGKKLGWVGWDAYYANEFVKHNVW